jgi:hypothetical protein
MIEAPLNASITLVYQYDHHKDEADSFTSFHSCPPSSWSHWFMPPGQQYACFPIRSCRRPSLKQEQSSAQAARQIGARERRSAFASRSMASGIP